jgi:hypothetical protein
MEHTILSCTAVHEDHDPSGSGGFLGSPTDIDRRGPRADGAGEDPSLADWSTTSARATAAIPSDVLDNTARELGTNTDYLMERSDDARPSADIREEARLRTEAHRTP